MSKDVRVSITTDGDPKGANEVALSIDQLEDRVKSLENQLAAAPVGGKQFVTLAENVKVARKELSDAQGQATKLAGTVGRQGNAGMAVLEFSRMFEDAQYGIRGVLNNIPGLIAMLGGGAGLAGVISLAAVLGTQLWERLGSGAKSAKDPLVKYKETLEQTKQVFDELEKISQEQRNEASKDADRTTERALNQIDMGSWFQKQEQSLEKLRVQSEGRIAIAKQELEIAKIDAELKAKSGTEALKLTERRRAEVEKIYEIEKKTAEQHRQQDIIAAKRDLGTAEKIASEEEKNLLEKANIAKPLEDRRYQLERDLDAALEKRVAAEQELAALAEEAKKRAESSGDSVGGMMAPFGGDLLGAVKEDKAKRRIEDANKDHATAQAEINSMDPNLKKATEDMIAAAGRYNKALDERSKSLETLNNLEKAQDISRNEQSVNDSIKDEKKGIENGEILRQRGQEAASSISQALEQILSDIGNSANTPAVQTLAGQVRDLLKDGFQKNEQGEVVQLLQSIIGRGNQNTEAQRKTFQGMLDTVDKSLNLIQAVSGQLKTLDTKVNTIGGQVRQNSVSPNF